MSIFDYFGKYIYINLEDEKEKNDYFLNQINKSRLSSLIERFSAINGRNIDLRLIDESIITDSGRNDIKDKYQKRYGVSLTYGSLGCALSHYLIYQDLQKENRPWLIFEDDIVIDSDFDEKLSHIIGDIILSNIDYDIVYLGLYDLPTLQKHDVVSNLIYKPKGLSCGTYAMIVSPKGAKNILRNVFPINCQIDSALSVAKNKLKVYASKESIVGHLTTFGSRTQKDRSCENRASEYTRNDGWEYKLFGYKK